jgi:hypothetical protein
VQLQVSEDLLCGYDAGVGADQELFEIFPGLVVDLSAIEEPGDIAEPPFAGTLQRLLGLLVSFLRALEDAKQINLPIAG